MYFILNTELYQITHILQRCTNNNFNIQYKKQNRKEKTNMNYGTVKFFNDEKGFGFIAVENGEDIFVHFSNIEGTGRRSLAAGQEVEFEIGQGQKGLEAKNVKAV